ncbi:hypothetical protein Scep_018529 [Stephania cephalantha]|uniref:Peptidase C14 caspase domain-containing protein n=1 Tax=Stephania cephalantha TaxID=152367 RepID=A0AAP0NM92_9MAGN
MASQIKDKCMSCGIRLFNPTSEPQNCIACKSSLNLNNNPSSHNLQKLQSFVQSSGAFKRLISSASPIQFDEPSIAKFFTPRTYNQQPVSLLLGNWAPQGAFIRRKALLCGVSYRSRPYELEGTINDVNCMKFFLVRRLGFPIDSIRVLTEDQRDPSLIPTKRNIQDALHWLIEDCQPGDSLVFYFSGHGAQQRSFSDDEIDGYDETICPLDYEIRGMITDDEINATIVRPLPSGSTLHALIDACHSGTVLDLPYVCKINFAGYSSYWEDHYQYPRVKKGTDGGLAICFSACEDEQSSADTSAFSGTMTGAMTFCFLKAAERANGLMTYGDLLAFMRFSIQEAIGKGYFRGPLSSLFNRGRFKGINQVPQLSSSEMFDVYKRTFIL